MNLVASQKVKKGREKHPYWTTQSLKRIFLLNSYCLLLPSYVLLHFLDFYINFLFAIVGIVSLTVCLHETRWRLRQGLIKLVLLLMIAGSFGSLLAGVYSQFLMAASLSLSLIIAFNGWGLFSDRSSVNYLTFIAFLFVSGAVIAFLYAYSGGAPLDKIDLYGDYSYFYITTFTNAVTGNLIRPAGIFDEPGALAMYLTLVVALNEVFKVNTRWSVALLFVGLVSGSFALFIVAIVYLLTKIQRRSLLLVAAIIVALATLVTFNDKAAIIADKFFLARLELADGRIVGDNRTHQMEFFLQTVNWDMTIHGQKALGKGYRGQDTSSNPFSIYHDYGLLIWIPYLVLELWLLYCSIFYRPHLRFPAFALFFTLLQRPYVYSMHWSTMIAVLVIAIYRVQRETNNDRRRRIILHRDAALH